MNKFFKKTIDLNKRNIFGGGHTYRYCSSATNNPSTCGDTRHTYYSDAGVAVSDEVKNNVCKA